MPDTRVPSNTRRHDPCDGAFHMAEVFTVAPTRVGFNPSMKGVIVILRLDRGIQVNKETIFDLDVRIKSEHDRGERCLRCEG